ncbi:MAG: radical SAM protein [Candidatus Woesearchaeota archaeon]|nr:radical SAM protein [Candidatus Woesearchaeota archaeon]
MVSKIRPFVAPYSCYITLTNKCNLRCLHCLGDYAEPCDNELSFSEWKTVIDDLASMQVFYLNISGGEPTQHPDFCSILDYLSYRGMHFILTTNGVISENAVKAILRNKEYLIGIKISLDGYDAESHCALRRTIGLKKNPAIFERTLQTIQIVKRENLPLTIATVLHSENIQYFDKFVKLIKEINPISWFISPIIPSGRGNTAQGMLKHYKYYQKSFWESIVNKCTQENINVKLIDMPYDLEHKKRLDYYECGAALSFCEINADGTVAPCTLCRTIIPKEKMTFENLREKSIDQIWKGDIFNQIRSFMTQGCTGCKAFSKCNKCIAQSFRYFGDGISPSPYCIENGEVLGIENIDQYRAKLHKVP